MEDCHGILIVEDDTDIRESIKEILELEGYTVYAAQNGREALEILEKLGHPCLILLDLMMPVMNGWDFLKHRANEHRFEDIPVVVATASEDVRAQNINGLIRKPVDLDALLRVAAKYCSNARSQHRAA